MAGSLTRVVPSLNEEDAERHRTIGPVQHSSQLQLPASHQSSALQHLAGWELVLVSTAPQNLLYRLAEIKLAICSGPTKTKKKFLRELLRRRKFLLVVLFVFNEVLHKMYIMTDEILMETEIALESM